jgi:hypothetical protein
MATRTPRQPGTPRPGGELRGSSKDRAARQAWLVSAAARAIIDGQEVEFGGNGQAVPCQLGCDGICLGEVTTTKLAPVLGLPAMHVDKILPGSQGGRYVRGNIRPTCARCNQHRGDRW